MDFSQIVNSINNTSLTNQQLDEIAQAVKYARAQLASRVSRSLSEGDTVQFRSNKNGRTISGTLESIKIKNAIVATPLGRYRVPMNMLEAV
jgi:phage gpG-like protein